MSAPVVMPQSSPERKHGGFVSSSFGEDDDMRLEVSGGCGSGNDTQQQ